MALTKGWDFRDTAVYVTDPANCTYVLGQNDLYPTTRNSTTFGWNAFADISRNRDNTVDARLAGDNRQDNSGTQANWRLDLPNAGTFTTTLAMGTAGIFSSAKNYVEIKDNTTSVFTNNDTGGFSAGHHNDATNTDYTSAAWPGSNTTANLTFATTTLFLYIGTPTAQSDFSAINHVFLNEVVSTSHPLLSCLGAG